MRPEKVGPHAAGRVPAGRPTCFACRRDPDSRQRIRPDRCRTCDAAVACALMRSALALEVQADLADDELAARRNSRQVRQPYARR